MIIDDLIENTLKNTKLKRVRIKVDPSQLATYGYEHVTSFEGYVLHEHNETVEVYIMNLPKQFDSVQTVDKKFITPTVDTTINPSYQNLKKKILAQLDKDNISSSNPKYKSIADSNNDEFLETYLKELGYDDSTIKTFYKMLVSAPVGESVLDDIASNPLVRKASNTINAFASIPKFIAGKNAILGKIGRFMRTLNPRELIEVDRYKAPEQSVDNGDIIYITGLPGLKNYRKGTITYQIQGTSTKGVYEQQRKLNKIIDLDPISLDKELDLSLDFSPLGNPEKTGTLIIDFRTTGKPTRYYRIKVRSFRNVKQLQVLNVLSQKEGEVENLANQEEVRYIIKNALDELAGENPLEGVEDLANKISDKILLSKNKEAQIETFDKILQRLTTLTEEDKKNLKTFLIKDLRSAGLI